MHPSISHTNQLDPIPISHIWIVSPGLPHWWLVSKEGFTSWLNWRGFPSVMSLGDAQCIIMRMVIPTPYKQGRRIASYSQIICPVSKKCPLRQPWMQRKRWYYKVNRCLARYSPRATTTNRPTTWHWISLHGLAQIDQKCQFWAKFGRFWAKNPFFLLEKS